MVCLFLPFQYICCNTSYTMGEHFLHSSHFSSPIQNMFLQVQLPFLILLRFKKAADATINALADRLSTILQNVAATMIAFVIAFTLSCHMGLISQAWLQKCKIVACSL